MPKLRARSLQIVLVAVTALLIALILLLIGSIHDIEFLAGRELGPAASALAAGESGGASGWSLIMLVIRIAIVLAAVGVVIQAMTNRTSRRIYLVLLLVLIAVLLAAEFAGCDRMLPEEVDTPTTEELWPDLAEEDLNLQSPEREIDASGAQYVILAIVLSTIVVVVGGIVLIKWLQARPQPIDDGYGEILDSITDAAHRLRAGEDPYTVVLFCYQEMIRILSTKGKLDATFLTPREFEFRLRTIGLSGESIAQLTGIFEIVRYAGRVDDSFAARALACLEAIEEAYATDEP